MTACGPYSEQVSIPRKLIQPISALTALAGDHDMSMALYVPDRDDAEADLRLKIFRRDASLSLSAILPHLTLLGVDVIDERPYEIGLGSGNGPTSTTSG